MKIGYKNTWRLASLAVLLTFGCKKLDINESPNNPSIEKATMEALFPSAVMSTVGHVNGDLSIVGGMWAQFWAQNNGSSQFRTVDNYNLQNSSGFINTPYAELYQGALTDYQLGISKAVAAQDWRFNLMNTVMKAYTYQVLVDLFDQVPYSEALQPEKFLQPKFDDGYTVYKSLIAEIDAALAKDYRATIHSAEQARVDFVFGERGNADLETEIDNWERFANTLKLKMYLRMVNTKPTEAEAGIRELFEANEGEGKFLTAGAGVSLFENAPNKSNPFYEYNFRRQNTPDNLRASVTLTSWLEANNDPRGMAYFGMGYPIESIHQGDYLNGNNNAVNPIIRPTETAWLFSPAEVAFMEAEALERYFNGDNAREKYDAGVTAAFAQVGLTPGALIEAGGTYAYPLTGTFEQKLKAIIVQKWASLFGSHALEAFFEQNRTGYPEISDVYSTDDDYVPGELVYVPNGVTGEGNFPRRFVFPDYERSRNSNTPAQVPLYNKVWWGK
ncbi:SusD/RagB family nutrient-binding outer membrane lipoprotein [Pedobacter sp. JY14-1]|uniref:SusD/RagB family nutrient-binding outer membrane lipoprotein n=1 Tax=Pedobacter sp. JY14-1 TaxID=3034151 RepID=UPI0023E1401B|nr:SusD/RagB family nutrient-binding outer membrane lipoprotein [Pedobacter sp. JY14-1]